jgi:MFS superfamily sulfate permease-like transporter
VILGCRRFVPRAPGALIAVVGSIVASAAFDFSRHGIAVIGDVPSGLPSPSLPSLRLSDVDPVLGAAGSCFIVILAQSAATARAYANRYNEHGDDNQDIVGLAAANAAAAFTSTFVVNGSPTKTEMVDDAGGRTQAAHLTTAVIVVLVLMFLTRPLGYMPTAVLAAIVFMIGVKLIDVRGMTELYRLQRDEFAVALLSAGVVVFVDVKHGILVAILLSLIAHVRFSYQLRTRVLTRNENGHWAAHAVAPSLFAAPGIVVYRFEADLFYANAGRFMEEVLRLVRETHPPVRWVVVDASQISNVDYTAAKTLVQLLAELDRRGVGLASIAVPEGVRVELRRYRLNLTPGTPAHRTFSTLDEAIEALRDAPTPREADATKA